MLNINEFKKIIKEKDQIGFSNLLSELHFLGKERIKLVGNNLKEILGRKAEEVNVKNCTESAKRINDIAEKNGIDFRIPLDWENLEKYLRLTLMDDITEEFKKQS
ncbi:MAG: hypothetical protein IKV94_00210 [Clostridia bacterium]|nr:hypothetical protein [Clostridia bacterium]